MPDDFFKKLPKFGKINFMTAKVQSGDDKYSSAETANMINLGRTKSDNFTLIMTIADDFLLTNI